MPNLLLINPTHGHRGLGNAKSTAFAPLNLPYIAAVTPDHYRIEVIDENVEPFRFRSADIVGITAFTASAYRAYQIAGEYTQRKIPVVMGGIHATMLPDEALNYCNAVVLGEAESVWPKVLADFERGKLKRRYMGEWVDLSQLPIPRRDIIRNPYYRWGSIQTSRGCPNNCNFCSVTAFNGRRFRRRPLEAVIEELKQIPQKNVLISDDNIIGYGREDKEWAWAFFERIIKEGIHKHLFAQTSLVFGEDKDLAKLAFRAGLKVVLVGMESVNPDTLKSFKKNVNLRQLLQHQYKKLVGNIRNAGIVFLGAFMIGSDQDNLATFDKTLQFIKDARIDVLQMTKTTPLPGTRLWERLMEKKRILNTDFPKAWDHYRFSRMLFVPEKMSIEDVYEGYGYIRKAYFSLPETLRRTFFTLFDTRSLTASIISWQLNASYYKAFVQSENFAAYNRTGLRKKFR